MWLEGRLWAGAKEINSRKPGEGVGGWGEKHEEGFEHPACGLAVEIQRILPTRWATGSRSRG